MKGEEPDVAAERAVSDMLRDAAAGHEPDRDRIVRRLGFAPTAQTQPPPLSTVSSGDPVARRHVHLLPLGAAVAAAAAAAVVALVVGAHLPVTPVGDHTTDGLAPSSLVGAPATTPSASSTATPRPSSPTAQRTSTGPPRPSPSPVPAPETSDAPDPAGGATPATVTPLASGFDVGLGGGTDWVAVVRRDGKVVRTKTPQLGPIDVRWTGAVTGQASPYRVSWSGGAPEQDHTDATTWLGIGPGGSATVTVPALSQPATVSLYLGAVRADVVVGGAGRVSWSHQGGDLGAAVVAVPVPASSSPTVLVVSSARVAAGGTVGLAAVTLG